MKLELFPMLLGTLLGYTTVTSVVISHTTHNLKNKVESLQYLSAEQYRVNQELVDIIDNIVILEENNNERLSSLEKKKGATHVKENWKIIRGNYFGNPTPRINRCVLDKTSPTKQRCAILY